MMESIVTKNKILKKLWKNKGQQSFIHTLSYDIFGELLKFSKDRVITVNSVHHWTSNISLHLKFVDNHYIKRKWLKDGTKIKFDHEDIDDFMKELDLVFRFTGGGPSQLKVQNGTVEEVYSALYSIPIRENIQFVRLGRCGCNMGNCGALQSIDFIQNCTRFEEIIREFGYLSSDCIDDDNIISENVFSFYQYPDSVILYIEQLDRQQELYKNGCYKPASNVDLELDPNKKYISFSYCR